MPRHLISLIDGTMVSASRTSAYKSYSNVFELACLFKINTRAKDGSPQIVFYSSGISSQPDTASIRNLVTGNSIKSQIVDQYTNICANFDFEALKEGHQDKIYLFGFSRGAMAVRALAGLIAEFGLLNPRHIRHLPRLLAAWDRTEGRGSLPDYIELTPVEIEFVGVFDSVMGGIQWMRLFNPIKFRNQRMPGRIRKGVQILAIDENRWFFRPKQWEKADAGIDADGCPWKQPFLRQIWMPGVHSDVGGTGDPVWGRMSLLAMTYYLKNHTGLRLDGEWLGEKENILRHSFNGPFRIRPHRGLFPSYVRRPNHEGCAQERFHPLCEKIPPLDFDRRKEFDWRYLVFNRRFKELSVDQDLVDYFIDVLTPKHFDEAREAQSLDDTGQQPAANDEQHNIAAE
jgi:uncharacterized protein (DUF2235 family)